MAQPAKRLEKTTTGGTASRQDQNREILKGPGVYDLAEHPPLPPLKPGWSRPRPLPIPSPTYAPAVVALGITLIFWGPASVLIISLIGIVVVGIGLYGWIGELRDDRH